MRRCCSRRRPRQQRCSIQRRNSNHIGRILLRCRSAKQIRSHLPGGPDEGFRQLAPPAQLDDHLERSVGVAVKVEAKAFEDELFERHEPFSIGFEDVGIDIGFADAADGHGERSRRRRLYGTRCCCCMLALLTGEGGEAGFVRRLRRCGSVSCRSGASALDKLRESKRIASQKQVSRFLVRVVELGSDKQRSDGDLVQDKVGRWIEEVEALVDLLCGGNGALWETKARSDRLDEAGSNVTIGLPCRG